MPVLDAIGMDLDLVLLVLLGNSPGLTAGAGASAMAMT